MESVSAWVLSIAGISVIGVLVDLILPNGQTKKYIKGVFAFIVVLIIVSPIPSLLNREFSISDIFEEDAIVIQEDFIYQINRDRLETMENMVEKDLNEQGIKGVEIKINANIFTQEMEIDAVFVDLSGLVINEKVSHIDINELVITSVLKYVKVDRTDIIFNS